MQLTYKKGPNGKSTGEEQKIDWFQLIQAEKTVGGSRILQEHFQRGTPIFEQPDETMRTTSNPSALNSDYF